MGGHVVLWVPVVKALENAVKRQVRCATRTETAAKNEIGANKATIVPWSDNLV
jgi:hypothetical protein